jgi:inhibitor of cysteine peptidase
VLRLPESPTTGYRWQVESIDGPVATVADSFHLDPDIQFGSGGVRELRFQVTGPGLIRIELKHWQSWEGERSVNERFTAVVDSTSQQ